MNKTITIPYDEYLEMEKCKKAVDSIKEKLRIGNFRKYDQTNGRKGIEMYGCDDLINVLTDDENGIGHVIHVEIWR